MKKKVFDIIKKLPYRDTEKLVRRHIALDKPVHGQQAAYMDIFVQPFDTRSGTAGFEYAFVLAELFFAIFNEIKREKK